MPLPLNPQNTNTATSFYRCPFFFFQKGPEPQGQEPPGQDAPEGQEPARRRQESPGQDAPQLGEEAPPAQARARGPVAEEDQDGDPEEGSVPESADRQAGPESSGGGCHGHGHGQRRWPQLAEDQAGSVPDAEEERGQA